MVSPRPSEPVKLTSLPKKLGTGASPVKHSPSKVRVPRRGIASSKVSPLQNRKADRRGLAAGERQSALLFVEHAETWILRAAGVDRSHGTACGAGKLGGTSRARQDLFGGRNLSRGPDCMCDEFVEPVVAIVVAFTHSDFGFNETKSCW